MPMVGGAHAPVALDSMSMTRQMQVPGDSNAELHSSTADIDWNCAVSAAACTKDLKRLTHGGCRRDALDCG